MWSLRRLKKPRAIKDDTVKAVRLFHLSSGGSHNKNLR